MPTSFENTVTGLYTPTITTAGTSWSNLYVTAPVSAELASVSVKKEEEPTVFNIDKLIEEAEENEAMDNGGVVAIKTKVNAEIRMTIRPKRERNPYEVEKIIFGRPVTVVFWADGTKTVVKCEKNTEWNAYSAFCAALAKKVYGNNTKIMKIVAEKNVSYLQLQKAEEKERKIREKEASEAKAHAKRVKNMAKRMKEQEEAAALAFGKD